MNIPTRPSFAAVAYPVLAPVLPVSGETLTFMGPMIRVLSFGGAVVVAIVALYIHAGSPTADGRSRSR